MQGAFEIESPRESLWQRWAPHIHTPGTALNDQYIGMAERSTFLDKIECADSRAHRIAARQIARSE
jgi:hypothetical protein